MPERLSLFNYLRTDARQLSAFTLYPLQFSLCAFAVF